MTHIHIDACSGAAGDMLLAALINAGADLDYINSQLATLGVPGLKLETENVERSGIGALHLKVIADEDVKHRHLSDMLKIVDASNFSDKIKKQATKIFTAIAEVEAGIHGKDINTVHFHEIAGVDTIADVLGVLLALENLGAASVSCHPVSVGSGTIKCSHGVIPLPAPATLGLLKKFAVPFKQIDSGAELLTPTGAVLLGVMSDSFSPAPAMCAKAIGYGAGTRELETCANVVRVTVGEKSGGGEHITEIRASIDDMTGEEFGYLIKKCIEGGARDAYVLSAMMKKGRPGFELVVLCDNSELEQIKRIIFKHSTTLGMRINNTARAVLEREFKTVDVEGFAVKIKLGILDGEIINASPEYDDCAKVAEAKDISLREVMNMAMSKYGQTNG